jgi:hypothetical protein
MATDITFISKIFKSYPIDSIIILPNSPNYTVVDVTISPEKQ